MTANVFIRQFHRWTSIVFVLGVILNIAMWGRKDIPMGVFLAGIVPLLLLLLTGMWMFFLPYVTRWRMPRQAA